MLNRRFGRSARAFVALCAVLCASADVLLAQQPVDEEYTAQIRRFTTEPFFLTPLIDHLPASSTVPTPLDANGYIAGAAEQLTYPEDIAEYMRAVAAASPRVRVFSMGQSEEGREMILVAISDEQTIAQLDTYNGMIFGCLDPDQMPLGEWLGDPISPLCRHALGGMRETMADFMAIWAQTANAYRRYVPKAYVSMAAHWGFNNRTVALLVTLWVMLLR